MNTQPPDLERFRATSAMPDQTPTPCRPNRHQRGKFLKGPIPWDWLTKAVSIRGKALAVSLVLWREVGCQKSNTVKLKPSALKAFGVSRTTAYVALTRLEQAGLISVERHRGRAPRVTILDSHNNA